jgi:hypothetical protein
MRYRCQQCLLDVLPDSPSLQPRAWYVYVDFHCTWCTRRTGKPTPAAYYATCACRQLIQCACRVQVTMQQYRTVLA